MADQDINYGVGVDGNQALAEIQKLRESVAKLTAGWQEMGRAALSAVKAAETARGKAQHLGTTSRGLAHEDPSSPSAYVGATREAAFRNRLLKLETTEQQIATRWADATHRAFERILRTSDQMIKAREAEAQHRATQFLKRHNTSNLLAAEARQQDFRNTSLLYRFGDASTSMAYKRQLIDKLEREMVDLMDTALQGARSRRRDYQTAREKATFGNDAYMRGREAADRFQDARTIGVSQHGYHGEQNRNILSRISNNGGADMVAIQSRIMMGYMGLSTAIGLFRNMSGFVVQLDKEFKQFQAITNTSAGAMVQVQKDLIAVSERTKFTALEVAQAATIMGQAGLSAANVKDAIEAVTLLATASGSTLNDSVQVVTSTLSIFNLQAEQAANIANVMTAALNDSKLSMDKVTLGLQYAGNTAAQFGVTYQELTAAMGAMANAGIKSGSTIGTGMRMLLVSLAEPTKKFRGELERLGLTTEDVDVRSRGLLNVMQTLKDSGFGAAEAYKSFEVRAASAFAAFSNNLHVGFDLEESFIGSNAAIEANLTQMQALSNQVANFSSVVGTAVYNAMVPFIETLTQLTKAAVAAGSILNEYPALLKSISIAMSGLLAVGVGYATRATAFGILAGLGLQTKEVAKDVADLTTKTTLLGRALQLLGRHPIMLAFAGITMGITAYNTFIDKTSASQKEIDRLTSAIEYHNQKLADLRQEASAIDQVILGLQQRQSVLDSDPVARNLKIREVISQFEELGGRINASTSSVQDLIAALQDLSRVRLGEQLTELVTVQADNRTLAAQAQGRAEQSLRRGLVPKEGVVNDAYAYLSMLPGGPRATNAFMAGMSNAQVLTNYLLTQQSSPANSGILSQGLGSASGIVRLLNNPSLLSSENAEDYLRSEREVKAAQAYITAELTDPNITEGRRKELERLNRVLSEIADSFGVISGDLATASRAMTRERRAADDARLVTLDEMVARSGIDDIVRGQMSITSSNISSSKLYFNDPNSTAAGRQAHARAMILAQEQSQALIEQAMEAQVQSWKAQGYTDAEVQGALDKRQEPLFALWRQLADTLEPASEEALKLQLQLNKEERARVDRKVKAATARVKASGTPQGAARDQDEIERLYVEATKLTREEYELSKKGVTNLEELNRLRQDHNEAQAELDRERTESILTYQETLRRQEAERLATDARLLTAQRDDAQKEFDSLSDQILKADAGIDTSGMVAALNRLAIKIRELTGEIDKVTQQQLGTTGDGSALSWLAQRESGGMGFQAINQYGYAGRFQFGTARVQDYLAAQGVPSGNIAAQAYKAQMLLNPNMQRELERWHFQNLRQQFESDPYITSQIGSIRDGVVFDQSAMTGYAHLLGVGGLKKYLQTGLDGSDANGTRGLDYARAMSGKDLGYDAFDSNYSYALGSGASTLWTTAQRQAEVLAADTRRQAGAGADAASQSASMALARARAASTRQEVEAQIAIVDKEMDAYIDQRLAAFQGGPAERQKLVESLAAERNARMDEALAQFNRVVDESVTLPLEQARMQLEAAKANPNNYSGDQMRDLERAVQEAESAERAARLAALDEQRNLILEQQAAAVQRYGENSEAALHWNERLAEIDRERAPLTAQIAANKAAEANVPQGDGYQSAYQGYLQGTGFFDQNGEPIKAATQMEQAWGQVFSALDGGLQNFFMGWEHGIGGVKDALKALGSDVLRVMMQLISRAMAVQSIMALSQAIPGLGSILSLGTVGVPMAVGGEVRGGIAGRDSVLHRLMPGEVVMRNSAVQAIGKDNLLALNNMGNRMADGSSPMLGSNVNIVGDQGDKVVNVVIVSPDQRPQLSENDILVTVSENMMNRKGLYQVVRSINMGHL